MCQYKLRVENDIYNPTYMIRKKGPVVRRVFGFEQRKSLTWLCWPGRGALTGIGTGNLAFQPLVCRGWVAAQGSGRSRVLLYLSSQLPDIAKWVRELAVG